MRIGRSWKRSYGCSERDPRGAICRPSLGAGSQRTVDCHGGNDQGSGKRFGSISKKNADREWCSLDSSYVRVHQHGTGSRAGPEAEGIGISRGGRTSKVHIRVDALGLPIGMRVSGGEVADIRHAPELQQEAPSGYEIADRGYDSDAFREQIRASGSTAVIPGRSNRLTPIVIDDDLYKERNAVERYFCRMKQWRRLATRYDKTLMMFTAALMLAHIWAWLQ